MYSYLTSTVIKSLKGHFTPLPNQLLQKLSHMVRPVTSLSMGPLLHFFCGKASSLIRSNAMWNTMMVDKAFFKNTNGSFGWSSFVLVRKIHLQSRSLLSKNKMIPFPRWKLSSVINLPTGNWLIASGNFATLGWALVSVGRLGTQQ